MNRHARFARRASTVLVGLMCAGAWFASVGSATSSLPGLHVSSRFLRDQNGTRVALRGVNRSGTEYACVQGFGIFDGRSDEASVIAIASWHINFVRVLLNEDCWLGINGVKPAYSGQNYRQAILNYVALL